MDPITLSVIEGRKYQKRSLDKRRADLEAEEEHLAALNAKETPPASPKPKAKCWVCSEEVQSGRGMGVMGLITGTTVLAHARTGQAGGCWSIAQRARQTILPLCKVGPKLHDKALGDRLLREEIDRMLTQPKFKAEVADQWGPSYTLTAKTGDQVRLDKIENEMREIQVKLYGVKNIANLSDYQKERDLAEATKRVDEREAARYVDPDVEFHKSGAAEPNYPGEHGTEEGE